MIDMGRFLSILQEGEEPVEIFGQQTEILPAGYDKSVCVGVYRIEGGQHAVVHFATGMMLRTGVNKQVAIENASKYLSEVTEETFNKIIKFKVIINPHLKPAYGTHKDEGNTEVE